VPVPLPAGGHVEGSDDYACPLKADGTLDGDCHLLVVQGARLFEMWRAHVAGGVPGGAFSGGCLAVWDLTRNYWDPASPPGGYGRGDQCSSADAGGFPISDMLFDADEVKAGEIKHGIRFILPNDRIRLGAYVHPATHSGAGKGTPTPDLVPYGARLRLKKTFDVATLPSAGARVVARALQRYGMFLADGGNVALTAKADTNTTAKWSGLLGAQDLASIRVTDFEMVRAPPRVPLTLQCKRTALQK
jgi:serine/threonine-protein kinase